MIDSKFSSAASGERSRAQEAWELLQVVSAPFALLLGEGMDVLLESYITWVIKMKNDEKEKDKNKKLKIIKW